MTLSTEIRFLVYKHLVKGTGTVSIFSHFKIGNNVDGQTLNLLHINRLIRSEVQVFFYRHQTFEFRSGPAADKFVQEIGPYYASNIKHVELGSWLCGRSLKLFRKEITPSFRHWLKGMERLTISNPYLGFIERPDGQLRLGPKTYIILSASENLASGRIYFREGYTHWRTQLLFVPSDVEYPPSTVIGSTFAWRPSTGGTSWEKVDRHTEVAVPNRSAINTYMALTYRELLRGKAQRHKSKVDIEDFW